MIFRQIRKSLFHGAVQKVVMNEFSTPDVVVRRSRTTTSGVENSIFFLLGQPHEKANP
jgi:hypothetical protein